MSGRETKNPDYLFEVSWEVCNKVGGIYTVVSTKALYLKSQLKRHHILIGPDVWMDVEKNPDFTEDPALYPRWKAQAALEGLRVRIGRWNVPGRPVAILIDYKSFIDRQDRILGQTVQQALEKMPKDELDRLHHTLALHLAAVDGKNDTEVEELLEAVEVIQLHGEE